MISVVIPCHKPAEYQWLIDAIKSIKESTTPTEVILVLDADVDALDAIRKTLISLTGIKVLLTSRRVGCYAAINAGLMESTGKWISFCGADDLWLPNRAQKLSECLADGYKISNTFYSEIDEFGHLLRHKHKSAGGVFAYCKELVLDLGGFEDWVCSADSDLYYRARMAGASELIVKEHLYKYRQHPHQMTRAEATRVGSNRRMMYERRWHDPNRIKINMVVPGYEVVWCA